MGREPKGCGSLEMTPTVVYQLVRDAVIRWRRLIGHMLLVKVTTGVEFVDGERKKKAGSSLNSTKGMCSKRVGHNI